MEERRFHPLDYVSVLRRRKWWFVAPLVLSIVVGAALAMLLPREYTSRSGDRHRRSDALARTAARRAVARRRGTSARHFPAAAEQERARAGRPRREPVARQAGRADSGRSAVECRETHRRAAADRPHGPRTRRGRQLPARLRRCRARSRAAHHQPARHRVRRGELQDEDAAGAEHLGSARPAAEGEPGAAGEAAGAAADEEAGEHRPAARSDERQRVDGQRHAPAARVAVAAVAHRAGPAVDGRGAARADEAGPGPAAR